MIKESPVKGLASVLTCLLLAVHYFVRRLASMRLLREPFLICDFIFIFHGLVIHVSVSLWSPTPHLPPLTSFADIS